MYYDMRGGWHNLSGLGGVVLGLYVCVVIMGGAGEVAGIDRIKSHPRPDCVSILGALRFLFCQFCQIALFGRKVDKRLT